MTLLKMTEEFARWSKLDAKHPQCHKFLFLYLSGVNCQCTLLEISQTNDKDTFLVHLVMHVTL